MSSVSEWTGTGRVQQGAGGSSVLLGDWLLSALSVFRAPPLHEWGVGGGFPWHQHSQGSQLFLLQEEVSPGAIFES